MVFPASVCSLFIPFNDNIVHSLTFMSTIYKSLDTLSSDSTSLTLLARVKSRDEQAWQRLVHLYGPVIFHWCQRAGLQPADAADLTQEVFVAVAQSIDGFRRDRPDDTFRGWLWTIARNKIRDFFSRRNGTPQPVGGSTANDRLGQIPDTPPDLDETENDFLDTVAQRGLELIRSEFEDRTWNAFWRMAVDGQTAQDVAAELDMNPHSVRQAKYRVLRRLREELDGLLD